MSVKSWMLFFIASTTFFTVQAQLPKGYLIHGYIPGLNEGETVTMKLSNSVGKGAFTDYLVSCDTGVVKDGRFTIAGFVPEGPRRYQLVFSKHKGRAIDLFIDNREDITIRSTEIDQILHYSMLHYVTIEGSPTVKSFLCLEPVENLYFQSIGRINGKVKQIKDSIGFDGNILDGLFVARDILNDVYSLSLMLGDGNPEDGRDPEIKTANLFLPTDFGDFQRSGHAPFWLDVYTNLDDKRKKSFCGKWLGTLVPLCIGQPFPNFSLPSADGKLVGISDLIGKNKLTLVHFWASHSADRKETQDELKDLNRIYHDKGLDIVGVSSDMDEDDWKDALKQGGFPWVNVIDLKGKMVDSVYHEHGARGNENLTNVLVNASGRIVAWDVKGVELEWYLWRELIKNNKQ